MDEHYLDTADYSPYISAFTSDDPLARRYREFLEPQLRASLQNVVSDYFMTLFHLNIPISTTDTITAPLLLVLVAAASEFQQVKDNVSSIICGSREFDEYFITVAEGDYRELAMRRYPFDFPRERSYQSTFERGISIGYGDQTATGGPLLVDGNGNFYTITCAHLFTSEAQNCFGLSVAQPSYQDYMDLHQKAKRYQQNCKLRFDRAKQNDKENKRRALDEANEIFNKFDLVPHETIKDYDVASGVGKVVKAFCGTTSYMGRHCTSDYAIIKLERRLPEENEDFPEDDVPTSGYLSSLTWANDPSTIAELQHDVYVKKRGRTTGVTHGLVAGIYGTFQRSRQIRQEFWVLPEPLISPLYAFSEHGDSGSCVWTTDGKAIGIVFGAWIVTFDRPALLAVVNPRGKWDVERIPSYRKKDGSVDMTGLVTGAITRPITLVQSLHMILQDSHEDLRLWVE